MQTDEKLVPQNLEAEMSLLGSLLIDKDAMIKVGDITTVEDFYADKHREIFKAMSDLYRKHEPIDILSVSNRLAERDLIESIGGRAYLIQLSNAVPTSSHVASYARIVQKKATLRRLIHAAQDITALGFEQAEDVEKVLDLAEQKLFSVSQNYLKTAFTPITNILDNAFERIDEIHREKGKIRGVPTGFADLDAKLGGLQKSDLVILAARPSCGKTSLSLDFMRQAAIKHKTPVGYFSLEMSKEQVVDRLICAEANVDLWKMRTGKLSDQGDNDDFSRIGHAIGTLSEAPIYIDDSANANIVEIRTKARRLQMEHGLGFIIIDYLQLMESRGGGTDNRVQEVAEITRGLKSIARELNVPVLALSQLARAVELSKPAIPKLSHLRESGSIEQDADVVLFIYRKAADKNYRLDDLSPEERHTAEIHISKHRNGPTGVVKLFFDDSRASFRNFTRQPEGSAGLQPAPNRPTMAPPMSPAQLPPVNFDPNAPITATLPPNAPF
ncbi:MAG TPA: replicative DNA helicase [bacterium]|nr:MAG: Replicative DNA helicase [Parcubacteria group bacterium ADurb.Bin192]HPN15111.1 replicative DNA helicase [bacterium]